MKILLCAATQAEIQDYLLSNPHHNVLITGVGIAACTYELTHHLSHHRYDLVIQAGIAGGAPQHYQPAEVVVVQQDAFGDAGCFETNRFLSLQQMGLSTEKEWLVNHHPLLDTLPYRKVKGITVQSIHTHPDLMQQLQEKWHPDVESMEGAALHLVCGKLNMPYLQLRSISNRIGDRDKNNWQVAEALTALHQALQQLTNRLTLHAA